MFGGSARFLGALMAVCVGLANANPKPDSRLDISAAVRKAVDGIFALGDHNEDADQFDDVYDSAEQDSGLPPSYINQDDLLKKLHEALQGDEKVLKELEEEASADEYKIVETPAPEVELPPKELPPRILPTSSAKPLVVRSSSVPSRIPASRQSIEPREDTTRSSKPLESNRPRLPPHLPKGESAPQPRSSQSPINLVANGLEASSPLPPQHPKSERIPDVPRKPSDSTNDAVHVPHIYSSSPAPKAKEDNKLIPNSVRSPPAIPRSTVRVRQPEASSTPRPLNPVALPEIIIPSLPRSSKAPASQAPASQSPAPQRSSRPPQKPISSSPPPVIVSSTKGSAPKSPESLATVEIEIEMDEETKAILKRLDNFLKELSDKQVEKRKPAAAKTPLSIEVDDEAKVSGIVIPYLNDAELERLARRALKIINAKRHFAAKQNLVAVLRGVRDYLAKETRLDVVVSYLDEENVLQAQILGIVYEEAKRADDRLIVKEEGVAFY